MCTLYFILTRNTHASAMLVKNLAEQMMNSCLLVFLLPFFFFFLDCCCFLQPGVRIQMYVYAINWGNICSCTDHPMPHYSSFFFQKPCGRRQKESEQISLCNLLLAIILWLCIIIGFCFCYWNFIGDTRRVFPDEEHDDWCLIMEMMMMQEKAQCVNVTGQLSGLLFPSFHDPKPSSWLWWSLFFSFRSSSPFGNRN